MLLMVHGLWERLKAPCHYMLYVRVTMVTDFMCTLPVFTQNMYQSLVWSDRAVLKTLGPRAAWEMDQVKSMEPCWGATAAQPTQTTGHTSCNMNISLNLKQVAYNYLTWLICTFNPVHLIKTEMMTGPNPLPLKNSAAENLVVPCICIKKAERY